MPAERGDESDGLRGGGIAGKVEISGLIFSLSYDKIREKDFGVGFLVGVFLRKTQF